MKKLFLSAGHNLKKHDGANKLIDETIETIRLRDAIFVQAGFDRSQCQTDNDYVTLTKTIQAVNKFCSKNDVAVEIHFNSSANTAATGVEALVSNNAKEASREIARQLAETVANVLHIANRGVKTELQSQHGTLGFVSKTNCAAVILEICFCSNANDVASFKNNYLALVDALAAKLNEIIQ